MDIESLKGKLSLNLETASLIFAGILIGSVVAYAGMNIGVESGQQVAQDLKTVLEQQSGQNFEVVNVETQNRLYKVDLKNANDQLRTYYVTKDGSSFTSGLTNIQNLQTAIDARNQFRQCLSNKGVVLYGNASQRATQLQIQALGGTQTVAPIYQDVRNNQTLRQAIQRGVRQVPSFYYNGSAISGVNRLTRVEQFTGCSYGGQN